MFLVEFAASQAVQQSRRLIINGQSGQVSVLQMNGRSFVDLEALAQLANGSLGFHGDQIVLSLPASAGNVPAKAPSSCQPALSSGATIVVNLLGSRSDIEKSIFRLLAFHKIRTLARQTSVPQILRKHFHRYTPGDLVTTCRTFPPASRVDLQLALDEFFAQKHGTRRLGLNLPDHPGLEIGIAQLLGASVNLDIGPLQYDDVDVGEALPARCLRRALWLSTAEGAPLAVLVRSSGFSGMLALQVEIAVPGGEAGLKFSEQFFDTLEKDINKGRAYRGKVISLEGVSDHGGGRTGVVKGSPASPSLPPGCHTSRKNHSLT
jgi:hypothetical protein